MLVRTGQPPSPVPADKDIDVWDKVRVPDLPQLPPNLVITSKSNRIRIPATKNALLATGSKW